MPNAVWSLRFGEAGYPARLAACADAPRVLHGRGTLPHAGRAIAIVGSRAATRTARDRAEASARAAVAAGVAVVSGGALGVDAAVHRGALDAGGETVAVLGTPIDVLYPPRNRALLEEIARRGALVTPFDRGAAVRRWNFPKRNRIVAGMADAVLVVEAGARSGSLSTAAAARAYGRTVLAFDDSPGAHRLIAEGAVGVDAPEDVLAALDGRAPVRRGPIVDAADDAERALLRALGREPRTVDEAAAAAGLPAGRAAAALFSLELRGAALRTGEGYVST